MLVIVASLLLVDLVFLSTWVAIDPLKTEILRFEELVSNNNTVTSLSTQRRMVCLYTSSTKLKINFPFFFLLFVPYFVPQSYKSGTLETQITVNFHPMFEVENVIKKVQCIDRPTNA